MKTEIKLKLVKRPDGWWITNLPEGFDDCGPYDTRVEAEEDRAGVERTLKKQI
jgi:hypothetical protein